jgi:GNAT superfamily N-acetyltransferase
VSRLEIGKYLHWTVEVWDKADVIAQAHRFEPVLAVLFEATDWSGLAARWDWRHQVCAVVALDVAGALVGFKLAYVKEGGWLHSWLGGVLPVAQGHGLATHLVGVQHDWAAAAGFEAMTTSTRQPNAAMAVVNLKSGYRISGFEQAPGQPAVVHFFKPLR